ncbi:MAG: hypothetical protein M3401_04350 [Actinomycetota bacterium]|nr:hypothetical protein [Actinomycetota bacterium]
MRPAQAVALARKSFPQQMRAPLFSGRELGHETTVVDRRGDGTALVKDKNGKRMLLVASQPLEAKDEQGKLAPVDLSLERTADGIAPVNSRVPFVVDPSSAAKVRFTGMGMGMQLAGAQDQSGKQRTSAIARTAQLADDRVFFANVHSDTDAGIVPLPNGSELFLVARSQRAPERFSLAFDLPAGATLRRAVSDTPVPAGLPRSIEIVKDGKTLAHVSAPIAHDADGRGVPASNEHRRPRRRS